MSIIQPNGYERILTGNALCPTHYHLYHFSCSVSALANENEKSTHNHTKETNSEFEAK